MISIRNLAATYSIVAVDLQSGLMGAAVQSHFFSVGSTVIQAEPGVGVVATQSVVNREAAPQGVALLGQGATPDEALRMILAADESRELRQIAMITPQGATATHTGLRCIAEAGHVSQQGVSVQANMMDEKGVPEAMIHSWNHSSGPLAERLLLALEAAEAAGGDIRGRQSAAIVTVSTTVTGSAARRRPLELRVEDHKEPLEELRRLMDLHLGYAAAEAGDEALAQDDTEGSARHYQQALALAPEKEELRFWEALGIAAAGEMERGRSRLQEILQQEARWRRLGQRLPPTGLFPFTSRQWDALLADRPGTLLHVTTQRQWQEARDGSGEVREPSLAADGFIHCCFPHQLSGVLERWFPGDRSLLVVLMAELADLEHLIRFERPPGEVEEFPHLYGPLPVSLVREATSLPVAGQFNRG